MANKILDFSSSADLDYFNTPGDANAYIVVENGHAKFYSTKFDNFRHASIIMSKLDYPRLDQIKYSCYFIGYTAASKSDFPSVVVYFSNGKNVKFVMYNSFGWSGYTEHYLNTLYAHRGYAVLYESTGANVKLWKNPTGYHAGIVQYEIKYIRSAGRLELSTNKGDKGSINLGYGPEVYMTGFEFQLNNVWYNNQTAAYLDWVEFKYLPSIDTNIGGVWKATESFVNVNGTWKQPRLYTNINGVWKGV